MEATHRPNDYSNKELKTMSSADRDQAVRGAADEIQWIRDLSLLDESVRFIAGAIVGQDAPQIEGQVGRRIRKAVADSLAKAALQNWTRSRWNDAAVKIARDYIGKYGQPAVPESEAPAIVAPSIVQGVKAGRILDNIANRDELADWWAGILSAPVVPAWIAEAGDGNCG
jgi:hypothetical protein